MKVKITKSENVKKFSNIFKNIGHLQELFKINFTEDGLTGQAMDSAHVCLFELCMKKDWFCEYDVDEPVSIGVASVLFCKMIECLNEGQEIILHMDENSDRLSMDLVGEKGLNKYFEVPLIDIDLEEVEVPDTEYQADIELKSDIFQELVDQFELFNDALNIKCDDEHIDMTSNGEQGKMSIKIDADDIIEYAIEEDLKISLTFSLPYLHKMCMFKKLATSVSLHLSNETPMKLQYKLGDNDEEDENYLRFFLASKVEDE